MHVKKVQRSACQDFKAKEGKQMGNYVWFNHFLPLPNTVPWKSVFSPQFHLRHS